jgi:Spy/CpxP family protein refolding chaperone
MRKLIAAASLLIVAAALTGTTWAIRTKDSRATHGEPSESGRFVDELLELPDLTEAQRSEFIRIRTANAPWFAQLEEGLRATSAALREVERSEPFDALLANRIVAQRAELAAHFWGAEARIAAEVYPLLSTKQREAFRALRARAQLHDEAVTIR